MSERVSIVLPNFCPDATVRAHMLAFLRSLTACTDPAGYQFVVVENGSESPELRALADIYLHEPEPIGYARAVNLGITQADHDLLVIANNDLILPPNWLPQLIADYKAYGPGVLSPMDRPCSPGIYRNASWYSLFITDRKTFGYFDETLNYRYHDQQKSIELRKAGHFVGRTGRVVVQHVNSATYERMPVKDEETAERNLMIARHGAEHFVDWLQLR